MLVNSDKLVYRVNWLRAKARRDRWIEEKDLLQSELTWAKRYFEKQVVVWQTRARVSSVPGLTCHAYGHARNWDLLRLQASRALQSM